MNSRVPIPCFTFLTYFNQTVQMSKTSGSTARQVTTTLHFTHTHTHTLNQEHFQFVSNRSAAVGTLRQTIRTRQTRHDVTARVEGDTFFFDGTNGANR